VAKNNLQYLFGLLPKPLQNRYVLTATLFLAWLVFVDRHDVLTQFSLWRSEKKLTAERDGYRARIDEAKQRNLDLEQNKEKYARELYFMHRSNEEVFIIDEQ
jgi:cell division protein DivIC